MARGSKSDYQRWAEEQREKYNATQCLLVAKASVFDQIAANLGSDLEGDGQMVREVVEKFQEIQKQ